MIRCWYLPYVVGLYSLALCFVVGVMFPEPDLGCTNQGGGILTGSAAHVVCCGVSACVWRMVALLCVVLWLPARPLTTIHLVVIRVAFCIVFDPNFYGSTMLYILGSPEQLRQACKRCHSAPRSASAFPFANAVVGRAHALTRALLASAKGPTKVPYSRSARTDLLRLRAVATLHQSYCIVR